MDKVEEALFREELRRVLADVAALPEINISALGRSAGLSPTEMGRVRESGAGGLPKLVKLHGRLDWLCGKLAEAAPEGHDVEAEARIKTQECRECGQTTPTYFDNQRLFYCGHCGEYLGKVCPKCGHMNADATAKFCNGCGQPLTDEAFEQAAKDEEELADAAMTESQRRQKKRAAASKSRRKRIKDGDEIDF